VGKPLSNRQRRALRKATPAKARRAVPDGSAEVKVAAKAEAAEKRDGLEWLAAKKRLSAEQLAEGFRYRGLFRDAGPVAMRSCLDVGAGGGSAGPKGYVDIVLVASADARAELDLIRALVLRGQSEMLTVMDGVCGLGWTVRALAGGDQGRARELEALLRAALDQVIAWRGAKKAA
jgi:hypothetical protein